MLCLYSANLSPTNLIPNLTGIWKNWIWPLCDPWKSPGGSGQRVTFQIR